MTLRTAQPCPCRTQRDALPYQSCCGRYHAAGDLHMKAPDAEALMRSRYSAFVLGLDGYLRDTWHASTHPAYIEPDPPGLKWLGLDVRRHTLQAADQATVVFVARSKRHGRAHRLVETSRFVREDGRWFYVDGESA